MKKIAILYFSGVGSTEKVAHIIHSSIKDKSTSTLCSIEQVDNIKLDEYDGLVIGTPVYHAAPARLLLDFFCKLPPLPKPVPTFLYNTRAMLSCNTNRILAKHLRRYNIITVLDRDYRSPASDGTLIVPFVQRFFEFDKDLLSKVSKDSHLFLEKMKIDNGYIPRFRMSSIVNAPNKLAGHLKTLTIYTHRNRCIKCGKCIANCPYNAMHQDIDKYPKFIASECENCYRCIHHCPHKALSLSKRRAPNKLLDIR